MIPVYKKIVYDIFLSFYMQRLFLMIQEHIDGWFVNGSARITSYIGDRLRGVQTGYVYHYAFAIMIGVAAMLTWVML